MPNLYTQQDSNIRRTWVLMTCFLVLVIALGWLFSRVYGEPTILYAAVIFSVGMNFFAYFASDSVALAASHAQALEPAGNERLYRIVENLCITAGLPMPRLYMIPGEQINAFATGRNAKHAAVAVTQGALERLNDNELSGVLAHELSHVGNRDILLSSAVVVLAGIIALMSDFFLRVSFYGGGRRSNKDGEGNTILLVVAILAAVLAPIAATLVQLAISRRREYLADASGVLLTRYPEGLASALEKIQTDQEPLRSGGSATSHLWISNPLRGPRANGWFARLFQTHPPLEDRIRILRGME